MDLNSNLFEEYLEKHGITRIFTEIVCLILLRKPKSREEAISIIQESFISINCMKKKFVFEGKDFENLFDSFNYLNEERISAVYLKLALGHFVHGSSVEGIIEKHGLNSEDTVSKDDFIRILSIEY